MLIILLCSFVQELRGNAGIKEPSLDAQALAEGPEGNKEPLQDQSAGDQASHPNQAATSVQACSSCTPLLSSQHFS